MFHQVPTPNSFFLNNCSIVVNQLTLKDLVWVSLPSKSALEATDGVFGPSIFHVDLPPINIKLRHRGISLLEELQDCAKHKWPVGK